MAKERGSQTASVQEGSKQENQETCDEDVDDRRSLRDYFAWRPLPWWICFLVGIFLLVKLQYVYNESPCAVLGTPSPVTSSDVKKAFRTLSMCTHPDKIRSKGLSAAEEQRGTIIFKRASDAKNMLAKMMGRHKNMTCPGTQGELEIEVFRFFGQLGQTLANLGISDYWVFVTQWIWHFVTFESGFMQTILSLLWLAFVFRMARQLLGYMYGLGFIRFILGLLTNVVIGPIPTVIHFLILPLLRLVVLLKSLTKRPTDEDEKEGSQISQEVDKKEENEKENEKPQLTQAMKNAAAKREEMPKGVVRNRKAKKETEEERKERNERLMNPEVKETQQDEDAPIRPGDLMPDSMWKCINLTIEDQKTTIKAKKAASEAVQFDLLLILTKPIIPLCTLIALGQVWNGLFSSLFIGYVLRNKVPKMSHEAHHLLCVFFGVVHTLIGVKGEMEDFANNEDAGMLMLEWRWNFKDILAVMHMIYVGAIVTATSALGNEPSFAASFASGIALRIVVGQDAIKNLGVMKFIGQQVEAKLHQIKIQLVASDEVVAYSGGGIGDCAGGPFRMLFGDGPQAALAARILKAWLMLIPLIAMVQWVHKAYRIARFGKANKTKRIVTRLVQRLTLALFGILQLYLIVFVELNASNGGLYNFWVAMLFGCVGESMLSTFDVRASPALRQIVFLAIFLFI